MEMNVLSPDLQQRLALANTATRLLRDHGARVIESAVMGHARPQLRIDGAVPAELGLVSIRRRVDDGWFCTARLAGVDVSWLESEEVA
jgi:hypothetical protein